MDARDFLLKRMCIISVPVNKLTSWSKQNTQSCLSSLNFTISCRCLFGNGHRNNEFCRITIMGKLSPSNWFIDLILLRLSCDMWISGLRVLFIPAQTRHSCFALNLCQDLPFHIKKSQSVKRFKKHIKV